MKHAALYDGLMVIGVQHEIERGFLRGIKFSRRSVSAAFDTQFFFVRCLETS